MAVRSLHSAPDSGDKVSRTGLNEAGSTTKVSCVSRFDSYETVKTKLPAEKKPLNKD